MEQEVQQEEVQQVEQVLRGLRLQFCRFELLMRASVSLFFY